MNSPRNTAADGWFADTHAHLYGCYPLQQYIESAIGNVERGRTAGHVAGGTGSLLIAEPATDRSFTRLVERGGVDLDRGLMLRPTSEPTSLLVTDAGSVRLVLLGGRQIVTREGLEILNFGRQHAEIEDGQSARRIIERASGADCVTIIPWGFGKWWFGRGDLVRGLLREYGGSVAVGDNGTRPRGAPLPSVFRLAAELSVPILPGSDPLPLVSHAGRAGSYGIVLPCIPDTDRPGAQITALLQDRTSRRVTFGQRVGPLRFAASQARLLGRRLRGVRPLSAGTET